MTKNWLVDPNQGHYHVAFGSQLDKKKILVFLFGPDLDATAATFEKN